MLTGTLGLDSTCAWGLVIFETCMYTCNWILGEPSICGWITPAMALVIVYLEGYAAPGFEQLVTQYGDEASVFAALYAGGMDPNAVSIAEATRQMRMQAHGLHRARARHPVHRAGLHRPGQNLNTLVPPAVKAGIVLAPASAPSTPA